jgi:FkbM family methyltransferase
MLIDLQYLKKKYNLKITGVIHVGAHLAEELQAYHKLGINNIDWFEANPELYNILLAKLNRVEGSRVYNFAVSDKEDQEVELNITSSTQSSSLLKLNTHKISYPDIDTERKIKVYTKRLDKVYNKNNIIGNFINLDIQGTELKALKGLGKLIENLNYIYTEVNLTNVYSGCTKLHQLDYYLGKAGFMRTELKLTKAHWGDAFYIKRKTSYYHHIILFLSALLLETRSSVKIIRDIFYILRNKS